jgi:hypothetical protein
VKGLHHCFYSLEQASDLGLAASVSYRGFHNFGNVGKTYAIKEHKSHSE